MQHPLSRLAIAQGRSKIVHRNLNWLIASGGWTTGMQKTGWIAEAGRCMVLHATVRRRTVAMVFLDAQGRFSRARRQPGALLAGCQAPGQG
ncbi:hypothetical protein LXA47_01885 [Massilia sp. P8910]|nr:hypothetical protein [Massilia antarctica]